MKILNIIREEIVPLSRRQGIVLLIIIACVFQFILFYAPALAEEAVKEANAQENSQETAISSDLAAEGVISPKNTKPDVLASSTTEIASSTPKTASTTPIKLEKVVRTSTHTMTAYNSEAAQTDDSPCITANGFNVCEHGIEDTIAANFLPMGTRVKIPDLFGDRIFVVRDRMNKRYTNRVDVWMKDRSSAIKFGVKVAKIQVLE